MRGQAHPDDILVVGMMVERREWPEFDGRQVLHVSTLDRSLRGRRFRHAYVTEPAMWNSSGAMLAMLDLGRVRFGGEIRAAKDWKPEPEPSRLERLGKRLLDLCERFG